MKGKIKNIKDKIRINADINNIGSMTDRFSVIFLYALIGVILLTCILTSAFSDGNTHYDFTETPADTTVQNVIVETTAAEVVTDETTTQAPPATYVQISNE